MSTEVPASTEATLPNFTNFHTLSTAYKTIGSHEIRVDVLVPKSLHPGSCPIIARFHGGGLVTGDSLFLKWFPPWLLQLATKYSAIIISANHRLMPEARGVEIIDDLEDFWKWMHSSLPSFLAQHPQLSSSIGKIEPDLNRILTTGESAGGWCSIQLALSHSTEIRAAMAAYPMIDMRSRHFTEAYEKPILDMPHLPAAMVHDHAAGPGKGAIVSADPTLARAPMFIATIQNGLYPQYFGTERMLYPIERVEDGARLPEGGLFILHGTDDIVVPIDGSAAFVKKVKEVLGDDAKVELSSQPGAHGFDLEVQLEDQWLADGLKPIVQSWLGIE